MQLFKTSTWNKKFERIVLVKESKAAGKVRTPERLNVTPATGLWLHLLRFTRVLAVRSKLKQAGKKILFL